jgi:hypothetical protein
MNKQVLVECPHCKAVHKTDAKGGRLTCPTCGDSIPLPLAPDLSVKGCLDVVQPGKMGRPKVEPSQMFHFSITTKHLHLLERMAIDHGMCDPKELVREILWEKIKERWLDSVVGVTENARFKLVVCNSGSLSFQVWRKPEQGEDLPILDVGDFGVDSYRLVPEPILLLAKGLEKRWAEFEGTGFVTDEDISTFCAALKLSVPRKHT